MNIKSGYLAYYFPFEGSENIRASVIIACSENEARQIFDKTNKNYHNSARIFLALVPLTQKAFNDYCTNLLKENKNGRKTAKD